MQKCFKLGNFFVNTFYFLLTLHVEFYIESQTTEFEFDLVNLELWSDFF